MGIHSLLITSALVTLCLSVRFNSDTYEAAESDPESATQPRFDTNWFNEKCDLSEYREEAFNKDTYKLSDSETEDDKKWTEGKTCEDNGRGLNIQTIKNEKSRSSCAKKCSDASASKKGEVVCCEHFSQDQMCIMLVGFEDYKTSGYGRNIFNPLNWFRKPKAARLFFSSAHEDNFTYVPVEESTETSAGGESKDQVNELVSQVNHLSVDGILGHLLSFYICMRWVPDAEFVKLATFELENTWVDESTQPVKVEEGSSKRDFVLQKWLEGGIVPMRCSSGISVQDVENIDALMAKFSDQTSTINMLYRTVRSIMEKSEWGLFTWKRSRINNLNTAMSWDKARPDQDSVYIADMRNRANRDQLPWPLFLRSSQRYDHHVSQSKNLFLLCFGPRVASYPHKRENGAHLLADINMAGCNGFWDDERIKDHMFRIKKLFDPKLCFTTKLQRELRNKFLETFMAMNQEFEKAIAGTFTKRVHELDPLRSLKVQGLRENLTEFQETLPTGTSYPEDKFKRSAGLLARASAKWVICPTKKDIDPSPFGLEDNFFRTPKSYEKWLGEVKDETVPECRTEDENTGCVKCVVAVKNKDGCHIRLNITLDTVFKAAQEKKFPFLQTSFKKLHLEIDSNGDPREVRQSHPGMCLVRKYLTENRDELVPVQTDTIVNIDLSQSFAKGVTSQNRYQYTYGEKITARNFWENSGRKSPDDATDPVQTDLPTHYDSKDSFPRSFIFTQNIEGEYDGNQPDHQVDYFMSCPCSRTNFEPVLHFETYGNQAMRDYYNGR